MTRKMTYRLEDRRRQDVYELLTALENINEELGRLTIELLFTLGEGFTLKHDVDISHQGDATVISLVHVYKYETAPDWVTQDVIRVVASLITHPSHCDARVAVEYDLLSACNSLPAGPGVLREQHCQNDTVEDALLFLRQSVDDLWNAENLLATLIR
ncbi:hypothetical protein ADK86_33550 [Streptomyces sp. NRRL F-5755]|uniref:hypothetical protein n=1 Tax=Streptomyces sp. NRRL F-5755 TaxID=1519475 RepID=UPI0006AFD562|nr:hypothetical protein [Streptomyces sp. NRRL F-5755]KOT88161.1 hypothetical protein ADK86_33550 [Streptomyces sp. NRRL F-5755]